jgi:hypothetical protein
MKRIKRLASYGLAASLLSACGGGTAVTPAPSQPFTADAANTWMSREAPKASNLLYVSSYSDNRVTIYTYDDGNSIKLVGTISIVQPGGMCTDKTGDVWVPSYQSKKIEEFAHGGTTPIQSIRREAGYPYACAVDSLTGDLAVTYELPSEKHRPSSTVVIYAEGQPPRSIAPNDLSPIGFVVYDNKGDLFVDGTPCYRGHCPPLHDRTVLLEYPAAGSSFKQLTIAGATISQATGLDWINPTLLLTNNDASTHKVTAYKLLVRGDNATVVGTLPLKHAGPAYGVWVRAGLVIVPDENGDIVRTYDLKNGSFVSSFTKGLSSPFATVVSQK